MPMWCFRRSSIVNALVATPDTKAKGLGTIDAKADGGQRRSDRQGHRRRRQGRGQGHLRHQRAAAAADQAVTDGGAARSASSIASARVSPARRAAHPTSLRLTTSRTSLATGRAGLAARPERLRQDHAAAHHRRHDAGEPGRVEIRGREVARPAGRLRLRVPDAEPAAVAHGARQCPVPDGDRRAQRCARRGSARWSCSIWSGFSLRQQPAASALRRHEAARRALPRAGAASRRCC